MRIYLISRWNPFPASSSLKSWKSAGILAKMIGMMMGGFRRNTKQSGEKRI
jgi:muramoyltetrapeptide carboxypeptidase LdcA involved in peptidoglycan recycling